MLSAVVLVCCQCGYENVLLLLVVAAFVVAVAVVAEIVGCMKVIVQAEEAAACWQKHCKGDEVQSQRLS